MIVITEMEKKIYSKFNTQWKQSTHTYTHTHTREREKKFNFCLIAKTRDVELSRHRHHTIKWLSILGKRARKYEQRERERIIQL